MPMDIPTRPEKNQTILRGTYFDETILPELDDRYAG